MVTPDTVGDTVGDTLIRSVSARKSKVKWTVERLLHWAYGIELVRGIPSGGDGSGGGIIGAVRGACHTDALTIDGLVSSILPPGQASLVRQHAIAGTRPDWKPKARFRLGPRELLSVQVDGKVHQFAEWYWSHPEQCGCRGMAHICTRPVELKWPRGQKPLAYCPVYEFDRPHEVAELRERFYGRWWKALEVIRDALMSSDDMVDHIALPTLPPQFPWLAKFPLDESISIS